MRIARFQICECGVAVEYQRYRLAEREDFRGEERESVMFDQFVPKYPQVPDVDAGVFIWWTGEVVAKIQW